MPRLCINARSRVISLISRGYKVSQIYERMKAEEVKITKRAIYYLVSKYQPKVCAAHVDCNSIN